MIAPDGHVIASVSDFDRSSSAGFSAREAQEYRAKLRLKREAVAAYCSDVVVAALDQYTFEKIVDQLISKGGHKLTLIPIGHDE